MEKIDFKTWTNNKIKAEMVIQRRIFEDSISESDLHKAKSIYYQCFDEASKRRILGEHVERLP